MLDKKPGLGILLGIADVVKKEKEKKESESSKEESVFKKTVEEDEYAGLAESILEAMKSEDKNALAKELKNFVMLCLNDDQEESSDEDDEE